MKLHLPTRLRAAVLACITAVAALSSTIGTGALTTGVVAYTLAASQAEARDISSETTVVGDTTYNGLTYIMLTDTNNNFASRHFKQVTYEEGAWKEGATYNSGNTDIETPQGTGYFWTQYTSAAGASHPVPYGNTLRLLGTDAQKKLQTDFSDFCLGGLIVEKGTMDSAADDFNKSAYWFYKEYSMHFDGVGDVNMSVADHVRFSYKDEVTVNRGGVWNIASTGSISFDNNSYTAATTLKILADQHVTVQGGGKLNIGRTNNNGTYNLSLAAGASLTINGSVMSVVAGTTALSQNAALIVGDGSVVSHLSTMNAAGSVSNAGSLTLAATNLTGTIVNASAGASLTLTGALTLDVRSLTTDSTGLLDVSKGTFDYSGGSLALAGDAMLREGVYTVAKAADAAAAAAIASALSSSSMHSVSNDGNIVKITVNGMATLDANLVAPPDFHKSYSSGLDMGEHTITATYPNAGYSTLYTKGLKGSGNITFNRVNEGWNLCVLWIDGDASEYTGTIDLGRKNNAFLKLGSDAVPDTDLSAATVNITTEIIALGGTSATIGSLTTNGAEIRAVDGNTDRITEMTNGSPMVSGTVGFAQKNDVSRNLTISREGDMRNTTIQKGVNVEIAEGALAALADSNVMGTLANNGHLALMGAITLGNAITMSEGADTSFAHDIVLDLSLLTAGEDGVYHVTNGLGTTDFGSLTLSNITGIDTAGYTARFDNDGTITLVDASSDLVWDGGNGTWDDSTENWLNGSEAAHFTTYDKVRFATEGAVVTIAGDKATRGVTIEADTTWTGNATVTTTTIGGDAVLTLDSGVSLAVTESAAGTKLSGSGTYILPAATAAMDATLTDTWKGTVALNRGSNTVLSINNLNLNNYAAGENGASTVELTAMSGYWLKETITFKPNLVLKNSPDGNQAALVLNNGYGVPVYTFAGDISGSGNWIVSMGSGGPAQNYVFEGDLSEWTGKFRRGSSQNLSLTFNGKAGNTGLSAMELAGNGGVTTISGTADVSVGSLSMQGSNLTLNTNLISRGEAKIAEGADSAGKTLTIAEGKSLSAPSLLNSWGANLSLGAGSALNITGVAAFSPGTTQRTWAGAGADSSFVRVGGLSNNNGGNTVLRALTLEIGASGIAQTATGGRFVFDGITVAAAADWTATSANATSGLLELVNEVTFATGAHNVTIGSTVTGEGSLVKTGEGTLTMSGESTYAGGTTVSGGTLDVVGAIGAGDITVGSGASIILHNKIDATKLTNNGTLEIASGFSGLESAGVIGIEGGAEGNGFNQGGETNIFKTTGTVEGTLSAVFNGATVAITADGTLTLTDDWGTYHINNALLETETFNAIKTAAAAHSANLVGIDFAAENQTLKVDADGFATSMVQGVQAASATLAVGSGLTVTVDSTTIPAITAADDAEITLNMAESASLGNMTGASTLHVTGSNASNTLNLGNSAMARELTIANATVTTSYSGASSGTGFNTGTTFIGAGGTLSLTAGSDALGWSNNSAGTITLQGEEGNLAAFELGGRATLKTNIVMQGNSIIKPTASPAGSGENVPALDPYGATLTVSGKNNVIAVNIRQRSAMTITVAEDSDLTVTGSLTRYGTDGTFTKEGAGTITFASPTADTFSGYKHKAGSSVFSGMKGLIFDKAVDASDSGASTGSVSFVNGTEASINSTLWLGGNVSILVDDASTVTKHTDACDLSISGVTGQTATIAGVDNNNFMEFSNGSVTISNAAATVTAANAVEMAFNFASSSTVTNAGAGTLTLTNTGLTSLSGVNAQGGDITLNAATSIGALTIAGGKTVTAAATDPLSITTSLTAGAGATLSTALSIANSTSLDLFTGESALNLGNHAITLGTGLTVTESMMNAITALEAEQSLTLFKGVSSLTGGDMDATEVFSGLTGDFTVKVENGNLVVSAAALPAAELAWLGGNGTWGGESTPWTSDSGDSAYVEGANVTIGGESAPGGTIEVSGAQKAKNVTFASGSSASDKYVVTAASGASLDIAGNLIVNEGVSAAMGFLPSLGESSSIIVNSGAELDLTTAGSSADLMKTVFTKGSGEGTIKIEGAGTTADNVTLQTNIAASGDIWLGGSANSQRIVEVGDDSSLTVSGKLTLASSAEVTVAGGSLQVDGGIYLGHETAVKSYKGVLNMSDGDIQTSFIHFNREDTVNKVNITGGTLTVTGNTNKNAFDTAGAASTVTISNATLTNGTTDMVFNHASTLTDATITAAAKNADKGITQDTTITVGGADMTTTLVGELTTEGKVTLDGTLDTTNLTALNNSGVLTITGDSVELKGSVLNNTGTLATTGALTLTDAATVGGTVNTGSLSLTGANSFTAVTTGALTIADSLNVTGALTATSVTITNVSLTTTALTAGSFVGDSLALTVDKDAIATLMGTTATTLTLANITGLTAATINGGDSFKVGSREYTIGVNSGLVTITAEISDQFIWDATTEGSVWGSNSSWQGDVQPTADSNVVFNGTGIADVTVGTGAEAKNVIVESTTNFIADGTGAITTDGMEVNAGTLTVGENVTVTVAETTSVVNETGNLIIKGALQTDTLAATGKDVQLSGTLTVDTEGSVNSIGGIDSDYGKLTVGTDAELTLLDVVEKKLTIAADSTVNELEVKHTGNLDAKGTFTVNSTADVDAGGVMTVAKDLTISDDLTNAGSITVGSAAAPATLATEDVTNSGTITVYNTMTSTGNVDNKGDATLDVKGNLTANTAGKTVTNAGNLQVGGTANATALNTTDGSTTTVKGNTTITGALNNGGTLTVGTQAAPATLATGDVVNNGTITVYNTMTSTGGVTNMAGKTLDVKGNLTANAAGKTVNNEGTMTIGGAADVATLTTGDNATSTITGNATVATALTNAGSTTIGGTLTATNAAVTNEATGAGEKLTVTGALTADTLTTAAGATTEAKGGATLGSELANHGTTTVTGDLASADATAPITITNDATGAGEKLTITGNVTAKSLTTQTDATTELTGTGKTVKLTDKLTNKGTTTIKGALTSADATATTPGSLKIENTGTLATGNLTADSLSGNGATTVTGNATMKKLNLGTTGALTASGTVKTDSVLSTGGSVTADTLDLSGLTAAATIANVKADKITLSGFNMLKVTDSISNENGTGAAKVMLTLDDATMSKLSVGDEKVVVATDGSVAGQGITLGNLAAVNSALKSYGIKGAMVTTAAGELVMQVQDNSFVSQVATSENGIAGAEMVDAASAAGLATAGTALGDVYAALDACRTSGDAATGDRLAAAVTGSSIAAMGSAISGDVERQLRAIRNRTTTMGVNQSVINENMPYVNAWVNAEGDYRKVAADGTMAGYKMMSWGGTVGMDVDFTPSFTAGLAATAMYGDFDAESEDHATGNVDTYYVSAFARYAKHRWTHTFVATAGLAETSLDRTILGHTVSGDSDGVMFGGMYEVGYVFALDKDATTCLQPVFNVSYTHASLSGYDESGANIGLTAGDVELNKFTVGLGARLQSVVGENIYNRSSILEARALVKFDAGDRQGETDVTFAGTGLPTHTTKSSETGAVGAEFGVGLTVPVGAEGGNLFVDASAEIRAEYTNVNATVGYRVNF